MSRHGPPLGSSVSGTQEVLYEHAEHQDVINRSSAGMMISCISPLSVIVSTFLFLSDKRYRLKMLFVCFYSVTPVPSNQ